MSPPAWTTLEEHTFLKTQVAGYLAARTNKKLWKFWPELHGIWFQKFPEEPRLGFPGLTKDGDAPALSEEQCIQLKEALVFRKERLVNWLRHHSKKTNDVGAVQRKASGSLASTLFTSKESNNRVHRPIELFQKACTTRIDAALQEEGFYEVKEGQMSLDVEDLEEESTEDRAARMKDARTQRMNIRNRVVNTLFNQITPEERAKLDELIEEEKRAAAEKAKGANKIMDEERTPEEYLRAIDESAEVFAKVHKEIGKQTGWYGFSVYGGPNPRFKGKLSMKVVCFGETTAGNDFEHAHGSFDEGISKPFQAFLKRCFSAEDRSSRALPAKEDQTEAILPSLDGLFRIPSDEGGAGAKPVEKRPKAKRASKAKNKTTKDKSSPALSAPPAPTTPAPPADDPEASGSLLPARPAEQMASSAVSPIPASENLHVDNLALPDEYDEFGFTADDAPFSYGDDASGDDAYGDDVSGGGMKIDSFLHEPTTPVRLGSSGTTFTFPHTTSVMGFNFSTLDPQLRTPQVPPSRIKGLFDEFRGHVSSSPVRGSTPLRVAAAPSPSTFSLFAHAAGVPNPTTSSISPLPAPPSPFARNAVAPRPTTTSLLDRTAPSTISFLGHTTPSTYSFLDGSTFAPAASRAGAPLLFAHAAAAPGPSTSSLPGPTSLAPAASRAAAPSPFARAAATPGPSTSSLLDRTAPATSSLPGRTSFAPAASRAAAPSPFTRAVVTPSPVTSSPLATIVEEGEDASAALVHIRSRPMTKPPVIPKRKGATKPKAVPKPPGGLSAAARKAAAKDAGKAAGKRPVGRPKKSTTMAMSNVTNDASISAAVAAPSSSSMPQPLVFSMPGNNTLEYNRGKDAEIAARKAALRAENARLFNPDGETQLHLIGSG
ncbi:hypothetical protein B0H11DRAFT_1902981 [Mycena galericulata]|nr:hypothetical protein B0H11DRAFT_1902981 [Mycena galericulata]